MSPSKKPGRSWALMASPMMPSGNQVGGSSRIGRGSGGWRREPLLPSWKAHVAPFSLPERAPPLNLRAMRNPRLLTVPALVLAVIMFGLGVGCGETGGGTAGTGGTGGAGGSGGSDGSEAPVITVVRWNWAEDCMVGKSRAVTISVSAMDDDPEQASLTYSGNVSDCTPVDFDGNVTDVSILDCDPGSLDRRSGTVTVTDPEDNFDTVTFEFQPCESGEVCERGDPCE